MRRASSYTVGWHDGPRGALRGLFELADDSPAQIDASIDEGRLLVARDEAGSVVGHLQLVPDGPDAVEIASIAVREASRGSGVGRRLVEHAVTASRAEGARRISVATATADIGNLRFYQRCGFRTTAIERDAFTPAKGYPPGLSVDGIPVRDAIRFELRLDGEGSPDAVAPGCDASASAAPDAALRARGLFEAHLTVSDLGRSVSFYRDVAGLSVGQETPERGAAFLWIGEPGTSMLGLWSLGSVPVGLTLHLAFKVPLPEVLGACDRLRAMGVTALSFFGEETTEPSVIGWMPAAAVYFRDPDGHLLELIAMLDEPPRADAGVQSWSAWRG